ncbi:MAG: group II intron reverse transcriptase/maturase [Candidatus Brocadia sp.]|nr:MAG: group II intron reverse transcriptase/maturase [Candidatus Brocadia sp.]
MFRSQQHVEAGKQGALFKKKRREMTPAERVGMLQEKLYCKAKQERDCKFYVLYDKVFIPYMLHEAYRRVKTNGGSPGIDRKTFEDIEIYGVEKFLLELGEDLRRQTYKPGAVKRVWIPKANGGQRPLGIPTIRDRVAQMACKLVIEPIFEADFEDSSFGFRPNRSAQDAMKAIKGYLQEGKTEVLDADLSSYFDTIPHDKLNKTLELRITDKRMLRLINLWLKSPVNEDGKNTGSKSEGTPQGGVISPLLANIYMHLVDRIVNNKKSLFHQAGIKIVRYADDFVLMGKKITQQAKEKLQELLNRMGLKLNETKTRHIEAKEESFNFLGFAVRYNQDLKGRNSRYWNIEASDKSEKKVRDKIREFLSKGGHYGPQKVADGLNSIIRGWLNYFDVPGVSYPAMNKRKLRYYLLGKLNRYYNRKSQRKSRLYGQRAFEILVNKYSLIDPNKYSVKAHL